MVSIRFAIQFCYATKISNSRKSSSQEQLDPSEVVFHRWPAKLLVYNSFRVSQNILNRMT